MKKVLIAVLALALVSFVVSDGPLSKKERKYAVDLLKDTRKGVLNSVDGLSDAQLNFKATDSSWSVDGCIKHIAFSEKSFLGMIEDAMKKPANPEKRADIKVTDEQLVHFLEDRSTKYKTSEAMKPENSPFTSTADALSSFKESRDKLLAFVNSTNEDLRNHVIELPFGTYDVYQVILLTAAHSNRHTQQIDEVKANAAFPKN
jgi:hypothetical protein